MNETHQLTFCPGFGVPWKRGLIFHGPPGNGKSSFFSGATESLIIDRQDDFDQSADAFNVPAQEQDTLSLCEVRAIHLHDPERLCASPSGKSLSSHI